MEDVSYESVRKQRKTGFKISGSNEKSEGMNKGDAPHRFQTSSLRERFFSTTGDY